jgi:hypothetical protein
MAVCQFIGSDAALLQAIHDSAPNGSQTLRELGPAGARMLLSKDRSGRAILASG